MDRFFRDAEGKTNRQLDVYFTLEDLDCSREKADPAIEVLASRGLINLFGPDVAFLTDKGVRAAVEDLDLSLLPKELRDFSAPPPSPPEPSVPHAPAGINAVTDRPSAST
ncbi:MAG: hypothetical protein AAFV29_12830, partial [Myxococcota bacterium]